MPRLRLEFDDGMAVMVRLRDDETPTVKALKDAAPFTADANRWGDEVYFETPVSSPLEDDARDIMEVGEVAYWPDGRALAVFFGRTPVSTDERPRAYSRCNIVGTVVEGLAELKSVSSGDVVELTLE